MRSPCRVEFVSDLDRNEDSSRTFPSGWCRAYAMGSPKYRFVWRISVHLIGMKASSVPSIYP